MTPRNEVCASGLPAPLWLFSSQWRKCPVGVRLAGSQRATINADSPEELPRLIALAEPGTNPGNDTSNVGNLPERDVQEEP